MVWDSFMIGIFHDGWLVALRNIAQQCAPRLLAGRSLVRAEVLMAIATDRIPVTGMPFWNTSQCLVVQMSNTLWMIIIILSKRQCKIKYNACALCIILSQWCTTYNYNCKCLPRRQKPSHWKTKKMTILLLLKTVRASVTAAEGEAGLDGKEGSSGSYPVNIHG